MAAKHDGKKARANFWVMQQNMAKQKGGSPGYQFKERKLPKPVKPAPAAADAAPKPDATAAEPTSAPATTPET